MSAEDATALGVEVGRGGKIIDYSVRSARHGNVLSFRIGDYEMHLRRCAFVSATLCSEFDPVSRCLLIDATNAESPRESAFLGQNFTDLLLVLSARSKLKLVGKNLLRRNCQTYMKTF